LGAAGNAFYNALWQQAAAEGITVLVAAGDNGAAG
jgi:subtilase family serine protease